MEKINHYINDNHEKLELYTTAITRAHGKNHPEAFAVRELYTQLEKKVEEAEGERPNLDAEFRKLREVTHDYEVPNDVCETYEATYHMLRQADLIYSHLIIKE